MTSPRTAHSAILPLFQRVILAALTISTLFPAALPAQGLVDVQRRDGLVVFVGMPDRQLLASVQEDWKGIVQVLVEQTDERVELNKQLMAEGHGLSRDGRTTLLEHNGPGLPYCDNSVNSIILAGPTGASHAALMRVLVPRGTLTTTDGTTERKPWPDEIDQWTHARYDATNNVVADDTVVDPPDRLRWIGWPDHDRHHNFFASVSTMVSARGRLFTIIDEGSLVSVFLPPRWTLTARDAFNGVTLWKRQLDDWGPTLRNFRSGPAEIGRRLVAVGDDVFVTLGFEAPVSVLNAATGAKRAVLPGTKGTEEILLSEGVVLAVTGSPRAELRDWAGPERDFTSGEKHKRGLVALHAATRSLAWQRRDRQTATLLPMSLAAKDGRGFFVYAQGVTAFELETGEQLWQTAEPVTMRRQAKFAPTVDSGLVVFGSRDGWLRCLRAQDGELVWRFRGAPEERQVVVREQLESVWPLHGATLVMDGKVYFAAGRTSVLDGGITVFCLDLLSGKELAKICIHDDGRAKREAGKPQDALLDVLSFSNGRVTMRSLCFTPDLEVAKPVDHLQSATGFLDDNFFHRSYWAYAKRVVRYNTGSQAASGYLVTVDGRTAYAYGRAREYYLGHVKGFERHLYVASIAPQQETLKPGPREPRSSGSFTRPIAKYAPKGIAIGWSTQIPVLVKGMVVAGEKLVVAGPAFELHPSSFLIDPATDGIRLASGPDKAARAKIQVDLADRGLKGKESPRLCVLSKRTERVKVNHPLASSPVFDGLIAAAGRLYLCREDGVVSCLGAKVEKP